MTNVDFLSLPAADEVFAVTVSDGARLPVYRLAGPAAAPALLFGHANGLAAGCYGPWLAMLAEQLQVFAFDARGHGGSAWPDGPMEEVFAVDRMAEDLLRVSEGVTARLDGGALAYAGHSLGGASALRLAVTGRLPVWHRLLIFEPPISPPPGAANSAAASAHGAELVEGTLKRRADWSSPEALCQRLREHPMYARFRPEMLAAHCRATLRPKPEGGYRLCCPPAVESFIFGCHARADTWARLGQVTIPVDLIRGDPALPDNDWVSAAVPGMAARIPQARLTTLAGTGHMLIFEEPRRCAELVLDGIRAA